MNNFSNEPKKRKEVRNAILKTIVKRYSFIVWLPMLIFTFYKVGEWVTISSKGSGSNVIDIIIDTTLGFLFIVLIIFFIILIGVMISYLRKKTVKVVWANLKEYLKEASILIGLEFIEIIKIPVKIFKRIINEPKKFRDSVQKEINKKDKKE